MGPGCSNRSELDKATFHFAKNESFVDKTIENRGHRCVGVLGEQTGNVAARQLASRFLPENVHYSPFKFSQSRCATMTTFTGARITGAHGIVAFGGLSHDLCVPHQRLDETTGLPNGWGFPRVASYYVA
jgi:hypothetical protein